MAILHLSSAWKKAAQKASIHGGRMWFSTALNQLLIKLGALVVNGLSVKSIHSATDFINLWLESCRDGFSKVLLFCVKVSCPALAGPDVQGW